MLRMSPAHRVLQNVSRWSRTMRNTLTPDMQVIRCCHGSIYRCLIVHQVTINVMLENESTWIKPIIKDLASHHMPSNTPTVLIFLLHEPSMSKHLYIEIKDLETRMMDMEFWSLEEEKAMVVNPLRTSIKM